MKTTNLIKEHMRNYGGAVAQGRALIDVRDAIKPGLRRILYANYTDKYTSHQRKGKFLKLIGSAVRFEWHGDASTYGNMIRASKPYAMRYPLYEAQGSVGNLTDPDGHGQPRYVEGYLSKYGVGLFKDLEKNTIEEWRDNYDNTEKYPSVLPSIGFWNLCNGTMGIGWGVAASIPPFNLKEMNEALVSMLEGKDFKIPMPDFPTGGTLLNSTEVRESLEKGSGKSCKVRGRIEYRQKEHQLVVTEVPYATYTNTICKQLEELMDENDCPIDTFVDATKIAPDLRITLKKNVSPNTAIEYLYKRTYLQNNFGINLTMLKDGKKPQVFTLREAMQEYLNHQKVVYTRAYEYELKGLKDRVHILDGYILVSAHIEEVVEVIKSSRDRTDAKARLMERFPLTAIQTEAVLKLTLARLASLEVKKFKEEREEKLILISQIEAILNSPDLLNQQIARGLREVANKYGDARRTQLLDIMEEEADRVYYFNNLGQAGLSIPKQGTLLATHTAGQRYLAVTRKGVAYRSDEQPKRLKKIFNMEVDDEVLNVFIDNEEHFLTIVNDEGKFRCVPIKGLNKFKTTLTLRNLREVYVTKERTTKATYKEQVKEN